MPSNVSELGTNAFSGNQLTELVLPSAMAEVGTHAFSGNPLQSISIPDDVILNWAALQGVELTAIEIGENVVIGERLLAGTASNPNNLFREAYEQHGAGIYQGTQTGEWSYQD